MKSIIKEYTLRNQGNKNAYSEYNRFYIELLLANNLNVMQKTSKWGIEIMLNHKIICDVIKLNHKIITSDVIMLNHKIITSDDIPWYPGKHLQEKLPRLKLQVALFWQGFGSQ